MSLSGRARLDRADSRPARSTRAVPAYLLAVAALVALPAPASSQDAVWSATLTAGRPSSGDAVGYCQGAANCSAAAGHYGSLSEPGFSAGGADYAVTSIRWGAGGEGFVHLTLDGPLPPSELATLVLHLGEASLSLAEARVNAPAEHGFTANYTWDGSGPPPEDEATVSVSLTRVSAPTS